VKLLLDTHTVLWFYLGDPRLDPAADAAIVNPANEKWVSPASFWEVAVKIRLGKYVLAQPFEDFWGFSLPHAPHAAPPGARTRSAA